MSVSIVPTLRLLKSTGLILGGGLVGLVLGYWINVEFFPGRAPVQPIAFSHKVHAGENEIPCQYCHIYARRSTSAGVPSLNKCVGCHASVAADKPQIRLVMSYWDNKESIPWIKVHDLPDFVHFPHNRHVAAEIECQTCHGPVEEMDVVERIAPLKMGWCQDCHIKEEVEHGRDCWTCHK